MNYLTETFYQKIEKLNREVKEKLKREGVIVPIKNKNGTITLGKFTIHKSQLGFFSITNSHNEIIADRINLPYTAALVANKLALGKWLDQELLSIDRRYGHAFFDELVHNRSALKHLKLKNYDRAGVMLAKRDMARYRKDYCKTSIKNDFAKLVKAR